MKKLLIIPSDPINVYLNQGKSYEYLEGYFNPGGFFDEVYSLSLWGDTAIEKRGNFTYIKCKPWEFKKRVLEVEPDVIRAYGGYISSDLAQLAKVDGIPIVVSVHDTNTSLIHESLRYADFIICMADCVKCAVVKKLGIDDKYIYVMPNRIDTNLFSKRYDKDYFSLLESKFGNGKHILHVGRKSEQKNLDTVIKSLQYLEDNVTAIFVGSGDYSKYESMAEKLGVSTRCFWIPSVKKEELPLWYSWCDCFCTPSRWEGFGIVFIEAAGCEAPIITSNIAPMNEYLIDGKDAILVDDYENPEVLAIAIKQVLDRGSFIEQICSNARNVGLRFSKEKVDQQEISIYNEVMKSGSKNMEINKIKKLEYMWKYRKYYF